MEYLDNYKIELHSIEQLNDECIAITFEPKYEYMVENPASNLVCCLYPKFSFQSLRLDYKFNDNICCALSFIYFFGSSSSRKWGSFIHRHRYIRYKKQNIVDRIIFI